MPTKRLIFVGLKGILTFIDERETNHPSISSLQLSLCTRQLKPTFYLIRT